MHYRYNVYLGTRCTVCPQQPSPYPFIVHIKGVQRRLVDIKICTGILCISGIQTSSREARKKFQAFVKSEQAFGFSIINPNISVSAPYNFERHQHHCLCSKNIF